VRVISREIEHKPDKLSVCSGLKEQICEGRIVVQTEQGHEIERPSSIRSAVAMNDDATARLQVGGIVAKLMDGQVHLPPALR